MRKLIFIATAISMSSAFAEDYWSIGFEANKAKYSTYEFVNPRITGVAQDNNQPSINNVNSAYGRTFSDYRAELELSLGQKATFTSFHTPFNDFAQIKEVTSNRLMVNVFRDFDASENIKPFLGTGLGLAYNTAAGFQGPDRMPFASKSSVSIAMGVSTGVRFKFDESNGLIFSYQYINAGKANTGVSQFDPNDEQFKGKYVTSGFKLAYTKSFK